MNLPDTIKTSTELGELFKALASAQLEMMPAPKDGANPHFKSRYATLAAVLQAVLPAFNRAGLSVTQHPTLSDDLVQVTTFVGHSSGQWMSSTVGTPLTGRKDAQAVGSAISYLRRYAAQSIAGLPVADAEDDGNAASNRPRERMDGEVRRAWPALPKPPPSLVPSRTKVLTADELEARLHNLGLTSEGMVSWCDAHGRANPAEMDGSKQALMLTWVAGPGAAIVKEWLAASPSMATLEARYVADGSAFVGKPDA